MRNILHNWSFFNYTRLSQCQPGAGVFCGYKNPQDRQATSFWESVVLPLRSVKYKHEHNYGKKFS